MPTDSFPHEVYARDADYVQLAMKRLTAERMANWLRAFADHTEIEGNDKSAEHARRVATRLERQVEEEQNGD